MIEERQLRQDLLRLLGIGDVDIDPDESPRFERGRDLLGLELLLALGIEVEFDDGHATRQTTVSWAVHTTDIESTTDTRSFMPMSWESHAVRDGPARLAYVGNTGAAPPCHCTSRRVGLATPRIVIVGGGFGGLNAARALAGSDTRVTLVDRRNHHLFQPLLYQVATAALNPSDIAVPIRKILRRQSNVEVLLAEAKSVDLAQKTLTLDDGSVDYDYLIV